MIRLSARTLIAVALLPATVLCAADIQATEAEKQITLDTPLLKAGIRKEGYVSGVYRRTFLDKTTGFHDAGFGLHIVDFLLEPGSDKAYRDELPERMVYHFGDPVHGDRAKRKIEGPQICTQAERLDPQLIRGDDFLAVRQQYTYHMAAPGKKTGSQWTQVMVFPDDRRYFISADRIDSVNQSDALYLRIDMPGHIRHKKGDTFSRIYLSYLDQANDAAGYEDGIIPAEEFFENFPPDEKFNYRRKRVEEPPERFIRAYQLRDPETGEEGPWLAGMTLEPSAVWEAWCHQRGYVCMIEEIGGRPIEAGESFGAAYIVGYFDSIEEMQQVYDWHKGHTGLRVSEEGWTLTD